jgi:dUTP pyrophosphatase
MRLPYKETYTGIPELLVQLLYPDSIPPKKVHETEDSGWDLFAHNFKKVYHGSPVEYCEEPIDGIMPGIQDKPDELILNPMERVLIGAGIAATVPHHDHWLFVGCHVKVELEVRPRSGARLKEGLEVHLGTVDRGYRSEIGVILTNLGNQARVIRKGDRIAQIVPNLVLFPTMVIVKELPPASRGESGFGDSGKT